MNWFYIGLASHLGLTLSVSTYLILNFNKKAIKSNKENFSPFEHKKLTFLEILEIYSGAITIFLPRVNF